MKEYRDYRNRKNPRDAANLLSLLTFWYAIDLIKKGYNKTLEENDLYEVTNNCESKKCGDKLQKQYSKQKQTSLFKTLTRIYGLKYILWGITQVIAEILNRILEPNAVSNLVEYFNPGETRLTKYDAYYNAAVILINTFVQSVYFSNYDLFLNLIGIEIQTALCSYMFRKLLKLSPAAISRANMGNIVTLITKDVNQVRSSMFVFNDFWVFGSVVTMSCYLLYSRIGVVSLVATGVFICAIPLEVFIGKLIKALRLKTSEKTDQRLQIIREVLSAIKIIKMYTWEEFFGRKIDSARRKELAKLLLVFYLRMLLVMIGIVVSKIGFYLLILAYVWMDHPTDASIVFFITAHFDTIRVYFAYVLPGMFGRIAELSTAMSRISKVLTAEEIETCNDGKFTGPPLVELKDVTVCMGGQEILSKVTFRASTGLTLITGKVGCGKSTLLKTILREYTPINGSILTRGRVSYSSQIPWLFPGSIKRNILFGQKYDEKRYQEVLRVCALQYDLSLLENGDETILTDNGQNLSKGQQARINLARAVYKDSEIYLLDDCLSALDRHVNDFIYQHCIKNFLKTKICILVTQVDGRLKNCDQLYRITDGFAKDHARTEEFNGIEDAAEESDIDEGSDPSETEKLMETERVIRKNIYEEKLETGAVNKAVYLKYITFGGGLFILLVNLLLIGFNQASESYSKKLMSVWSDEKQLILNIKSNTSTSNQHLETAELKAASTFKLYSIMLALSIGLELIRTYTFLIFCRTASINIHKAMVRNILQAVMAFFDSHFIGNVLNRFSQDINNVDEILPFRFIGCLEALFYVGGATALLITVNAYFSIYTVIFFCAMAAFMRLYLPVARNLKRLETSTRSPILGHLNAALEGMITVRSFRAEAMMIEEFDRHQNLFTSACYTLTCFSFAFGFFMQMLASFMITVVVMSFVIFETDSSAGSIGLALTQAISLGSAIQWTVKAWAELENIMTATERVLEYTNIKTECGNGDSNEFWSRDGAISYQDVSLNYKDSEIVLNGLNFVVSPGEKIGIVGRTGAGKSSIISTIFRLYEVEGKIIIDNVDIKNIPLKYLRSNLAIIPQDPVLFSGTIRSNLDPYCRYNDEDLWKALEKANLKGVIPKLDATITSGAFNFSLGQKQMICVARAILSKAKIVILDEATANMDEETENLIKESIRDNFSECTVITVAHRLGSILDCDKVMVIERGEIKEFDSPMVLLGDEGGYFRKMVKDGK